MTEDQFGKLTGMISNLSIETDSRFDKLAQMIKGVHDEMVDGFEQVDTRFEQIGARFEQVDARFEQIDTRFDKIDVELSYVRGELHDIRRHLEILKETVAGHEGHSKEIDYAFARIAAIEKHLGMQTPVASE